MAGVAFAVRNHQYPSLCKGCAVSMLSFAGAMPAVVRLVQKTLDVLRFWGLNFIVPGSRSHCAISPSAGALRIEPRS